MKKGIYGIYFRVGNRGSKKGGGGGREEGGFLLSFLLFWSKRKKRRCGKGCGHILAAAIVLSSSGERGWQVR